MPAALQTYAPQFRQIFTRTPQLSNIKPSEWAEQHVMIPGKGRLNYDFNPYCRKIIDMMAPDHPARKIAVMKGSQITFSSGVIMPALGYIIQEDPHNTILMVGTSDLIKPAGEKLDLMIHGAKLQEYIKPSVQRKRNTKTGDTDEIKTFGGGYIKIASNSNPKSIAQIDLERIFLDDFDAMKGQSKTAGSFMDLIEMRAAANMNTYKLMMISTPLVKSTSNIEPAFMAGDRERYFLECQCCHEPILIKWNVKEGDTINELTGQTAAGAGGIYFEKDNHGRLDRKSVGYVCYLCAGFFTDKNKQRMLREGDWVPTAVPISEDYFSFHISSLYAPVGMFDWTYYAGKYIEANPEGQPVNEAKMQVLVNTCWGETHEPETEAPVSTQIQRNIRDYEPGTIPENLSIADGNGRIVMITMTADMNGTMKGVNRGKVNDARLDWSVVAWAESGASYDVEHGSIGTFIPREGDGLVADREKWTYEENADRSVWPLLDEILSKIYNVDSADKPRRMPIAIFGLDTGHFTKGYAYPYLDRAKLKHPHVEIRGVKGDIDDKYTKSSDIRRKFKEGQERGDLYILEVGVLKDSLAHRMKLNWDYAAGHAQPSGFMNFPQPSKGQYQYANYFEHFEAEHRVLASSADGTTVVYRWGKKSSDKQNHMWDCCLYNMAMRDIFVYEVGKNMTPPNRDLSWADYAREMAKML